MSINLEERLDRIEAILEATALQSQKTDERLDNLTKLVEKHERSRMAFRQYTKEIFERFAQADRRHDDMMSYLRGQQVEMRRFIDRVVGEKNFDED